MGFLKRIRDWSKKQSEIAEKVKKVEAENAEKRKITEESKYDLYKISSIQSIPIPKYKPINGLESPKKNIEYILQRKATEHKRNGRMDLAIACLKKSNEIMKYSNFSYPMSDYMRLVEFLKLDGQFDEARKVEKTIKMKFSNTKKNVTNNKNENLKTKKVIEEAHSLKTDLLECSVHKPTCSECSKYQGRIFSISGKDERFPKLPNIVLQTGGFHKGCRHSFYPFLYGISTPNYEGKDPIVFSNRPFIDERSEQEKQAYDSRESENKSLNIDKKEFDLLREFLPEFAPKSFGGYRKMKNSKSANFFKIQKEALKKGIEITSHTVPSTKYKQP